MQVWNVLRAARWKCWTQKWPKKSPPENAGPKNAQKNRHQRTIAEICRAICLQLRHISTVRKKNLLNSTVFPTCPYNMLNFDPLAPEICWRVWGSPANFKRVSCFGRITAWHSSSERQPNFAALNRGRHPYSAGQPPRWALVHILVVFL